MPEDKIELTLCAGSGCVARGALAVRDLLDSEIRRHGLKDQVSCETTGCHGYCDRGPFVAAREEGVFYRDLTPQLVPQLVEEHFGKGKLLRENTFIPRRLPIPLISQHPFFAKQKLIALRNRGRLNAERIEEYIALDGYSALEKALTAMRPEEVVQEVVKAGLRGRGGAGFPTGKKWELCRSHNGNLKYIIANCDEGDPGAYMDRNLVESDPHSIIEGMAIGAYAIGARQGYVYIRTEYPLAIKRLTTALGQAREYGLLGRGVFATDFDFEIEIREGSGAFVCGEETSLIHSIEGANPEPRQRPPFPVEVGIWGAPTVINNVETLANIPVIISRSAEWFSSIGTETSKGTKVFSLVGNINNTGLIEVPMGTSLREIVYEIGDGIPRNKRFKAVQTGGPSGGCLPVSSLDLPIDYESLSEAGSIMGSGGMIVMDEDACMVDVARFFVEFCTDESCGKCTTCRDGSEALLEVLTRICQGEGREGDIEYLEELSYAIKDASMCGLGTSLPNPVLSTIKHFRDEYEAHIKYKQCPAVVCRGLISCSCHYSCPLKTDVPAYLTLTAKGEFDKALEVVRATNPLPVVCGRVCVAHCEAKCRAGDTGDPLAIREIKRFLSEYELRKGGAEKPPPPRRRHSEKVAIIGSGPAGLTAGYYLAQEGYEVTIFEKLSVAGGMLAVGIPDYRLPKEILQFEIDMIKDAGVNIWTNSPVEDIGSLLEAGYDAVLIAVGSHINGRLGLEGEDSEGILDPIGFLRKVNLNEYFEPLGNRVGVIGGGNTAIDVARTAVRLGSKDVVVLYRRGRSEMPAIPEEVEAAIEEGVKFEFLVTQTKLLTSHGRLTGVELVRNRLGAHDLSGRRRPVPIEGSEFVLGLDCLLPAISAHPDLYFLPEGSNVEISKRWHTVMADSQTYRTANDRIFACGDAVTGPADVATVMAAAIAAAGCIHRFLRGEEVEPEYRPVRPALTVEPIALGEEETVSAHRPTRRRIEFEERGRTFDEVELGYTEEMAIAEAKRCLRCDWETQLGREG